VTSLRRPMGWALFALITWGVLASGLWPLLTLALVLAALVAIVPWLGTRALGLARFPLLPIIGRLTGVAAAGSIFAMAVGVSVLGASVAPLPSPSEPRVPTSATAAASPTPRATPPARAATPNPTVAEATQAPTFAPTVAPSPTPPIVVQTAAPRTPVPATRTPTVAPRTVAPTIAPRTVAPTARIGCHPSYPGVCIPPAPPDLDCGDIPYRRFVVLPPDPHGFDGNDNDGIGCESN
jgi:hypothetical protein